MNAFYDLSFSAGSVICLGLTVLLLLPIPVVFWLLWRRGHRESLCFRYLIAGALGFLVSVRVLELGIHVFCIVLDNPVSRFINGNTAAYVLYGVTMAGVFEECGRYFMFRYLLKKDRTRENAVLYGIGHGGIEVWAVVLPATALELASAVLFSLGDPSAAMAALGITEETAAAAYPTVLAASQFGVGMLVMTVAERVLTMFIHAGLTVIVYAGAAEGRKGLLPAAIGLHMAADTFAALYQRAVVPLWACELWAAAWTALIVLLAVKLYRQNGGSGT